jgi:hypothetical protein
LNASDNEQNIQPRQSNGGNVERVCRDINFPEEQYRNMEPIRSENRTLAHYFTFLTLSAEKKKTLPSFTIILTIISPLQMYTTIFFKMLLKKRFISQRNVHEA